MKNHVTPQKKCWMIIRQYHGGIIIGIGIRDLGLKRDEVLLLSLQKMDNFTGLPKEISENTRKKPWISLAPLGERPVQATKRMVIQDPPEKKTKPTNKTPNSKIPTRGQIKRLSGEGEKLVRGQHYPVTPTTLSVAMMALPTGTVPANDTCWACAPNPPSPRPLTWEDYSVPTLAKDSSRTPGPHDPSLPLRKQEEGRQLSNSSLNHTAGADLTPMCMDRRPIA